MNCFRRSCADLTGIGDVLDPMGSGDVSFIGLASLTSKCLGDPSMLESSKLLEAYIVVFLGVALAINTLAWQHELASLSSNAAEVGNIALMFLRIFLLQVFLSFPDLIDALFPNVTGTAFTVLPRMLLGLGPHPRSA